MTYNGGFKEWTKEYVAELQSRAKDIKPENVMQWIGPSYQLQKAIINALDTETLFVTDFWDTNGVAEKSTSFMQYVEKLTPGEVLHIGQVLDYHF